MCELCPGFYSGPDYYDYETPTLYDFEEDEEDFEKEYSEPFPRTIDNVPFVCGTCGNSNPYVIGEVYLDGRYQRCRECIDYEPYMDSLLQE